MKLFNSKKVLLTLALSAALTTSVMASQQSDWKPVSSEKLVRLPANYISQTIENNLSDSPLVKEINALDVRMEMAVSTMHKLKKSIADVSGDEQFEVRHDFLKAKSEYLDLTQQKHKLDQKALNTRRGMYEKVLRQIRKADRHSNSAEMVKLKLNQSNARKRMERAKSLVDNALLEAGATDNSKYSDAYAKNVSKLEMLKIAITEHEANKTPVIDGQEVSKEGFVRHLLAELNAEQAIFDQEKLMLTYMAKLVALDAQSLEHQLIAGPASSEDSDNASPASLSANTDLFVY